MTKTRQATKSVKPTLAELDDEALDRVTGGGSGIAGLTVDPRNRDTAYFGPNVNQGQTVIK